MTEFIPFFTQKRSEFKETFKLMAQFLVKIDKAQDFLGSGVKAPDDPKLYMEVVGVADRVAQVDVNLPEKPLGWEQSVELAMEIIMYEGYLPTDVADEEELQTIKRLCAQKERYGQKVRKELHDLVQKCLNVWFYLDTIDKQAAFKEYAYLEKERERKEQEKEREAREEQRREWREAQREARADQKFYLKEQRRYDMWRRRENRLSYRYSRYRW
jgi:superfamily II DNA/RNA helicase